MAQCTVHTFCPGATLGWARLGSPQLHNRFKGSSCCTGNYNCQPINSFLTYIVSASSSVTSLGIFRLPAGIFKLDQAGITQETSLKISGCG